MPFEKHINNNLQELDKQTLYRFAELELGKASTLLTNLLKNRYMPRQSANALLFELIATPHMKESEEIESNFQDLLSSQFTLIPPKDQLILYLLTRNHSYATIREFTRAGFNTISKYRLQFPQFYPMFRHWDDEILNNWNQIKGNFNIFDESLAHTKA